MSHTNVQLVFDGADINRHNITVGYYFAGPSGGRIGQVFINCLVTTEAEAEANARRLIACWNRLSSYTTEEIEDKRLGFLELIEERTLLRRQLDKLLAALDSALIDLRACDAAGQYGTELMPTINQGEAVIDELKGGAV